MGDIAPKNLETTLGILKAADREDFYQEIKYPAHNVARGWFVNPMCANAFPRRDYNVVALVHRRREFRPFLNRHRQICIRKQNKIAHGLQHAGSHRVAFAAMRIADDAGVWFVRNLCFSPSDGCIIAAVINHQ